MAWAGERDTIRAPSAVNAQATTSLRASPSQSSRRGERRAGGGGRARDGDEEQEDAQAERHDERDQGPGEPCGAPVGAADAHRAHRAHRVTSRSGVRDSVGRAPSSRTAAHVARASSLPRIPGGRDESVTSRVTTRETKRVHRTPGAQGRRQRRCAGVPSAPHVTAIGWP